jgi:ATP phosphoribosyltransferase
MDRHHLARSLKDHTLRLDFSECRFMRLKNSEELVEHFRNMQIVMAYQTLATHYFYKKFKRK